MASESSKVCAGIFLGATSMLLKQLIESPKTSSKLVVYDPFRKPDQEELVREVIGLANADVEGPRNILFGVNSGAIEGAGLVGIAESAMADLKKAHRLLSALIEPVLHLAFIFDRINGKLVGALEIDSCDDGPYVVGKDGTEYLSSGQCWIREGFELRAVKPDDVARRSTPEPETPNKSAKPSKPPKISVGFNDEPDCQVLEMSVPDTSNPPFAKDKQKDEQPKDLKDKIRETIGTVTTQILRLTRTSKQDSAAETGERGMDTDTDVPDEAATLFTDADNHYFFEEKALKVNLSVCNKGSEGVEGVSIKIGFPRIEDFDVADRLYISPFDKRSRHNVSQQDYPKVEHRDDAIFVRNAIGNLSPDSRKQAFECPLRLAVGPGMQGRKIAIHYTVRDGDDKSLAKGRLKIKFGKEAA